MATDDIIVTQEMIEAGRQVFARWAEKNSFSDEMVATVYRAMHAARTEDAKRKEARPYVINTLSSVADKLGVDYNGRIRDADPFRISSGQPQSAQSDERD